MYLDEEGKQTTGFIKKSELNWGHILGFTSNRVAHVCKALQLDSFTEFNVKNILDDSIKPFTANSLTTPDNMRFVYSKAEQKIVYSLELFSNSPAIEQYKRVYFTTEEFLERSFYADNHGEYGRQEINEQVMYQFCIFLIAEPGEYERAALHALKELHRTYEHYYNKDSKVNKA